ncbi:uncharacterized protein LOC128224771 [Mya arenaria]|uniref:uncharacterized protein LOC128224771 n=1 Tax=Mya arenaria TaxID=6604 RepID=UPI0022E10D32|nr:uncharacterized protein LOC128224771 [Mya arenaria]
MRKIDELEQQLAYGQAPVPVFEPYFCVLRQDLKTFQCHKSEKSFEELPGLVRLPVVRLDDGKRQFDRRWGYETLQRIWENTVQHFHIVSTEKLYKNRLDANFMNESLPDLTRSHDSALFSKKRSTFKKLFHTSYEKLSGDRDSRRGSVPVVPSVVVEDTVAMETPTSTPSRFTNFLIRKGFKTNLKRTKSAHKLDRKRNGISTPEPESNTIVGTLKRTMSLGRLTRKRARSKSTDLSTNKMHSTPEHFTPCDCVTPSPETSSTW